LPTSLEYELEDESAIVTFASIQKDFSNLSSKITFTLGTTWDSQDNSKSITTAELYGKNVIVRYDSNSVPKLYIDNKEFLTFKSYGEETVYNTALQLKIETNLITSTGSQLVDLSAGSVYAITFDYGNISSTSLENAYNDVLNISKEVTKSNVLETEYVGSFLHLAGVMYFAQLDIENYLLAQQYNVYQDTQCSICITSYSSSDNNLCIDVPATWNNVFNLSVPTEDDTTIRDYRATSSMISSKLEDTIWHELTGYESASTTNVFEEATRNDIELLVISSANTDELSKFAYTDDVYTSLKDTITTEVASGNIVIIPNKEVTINNWHGTGYISVNPVTGITTDKVINRTTGTILGGGYSTKTVSVAILAECIFNISDIVGSVYLMDAIIISIGTLNPVVGGLAIVYGAFCVAGSICNYLDMLDLIYQYANEDQTAGAELVEDAVQDAIWEALSFGLNQAVKYMETPAVKSKYIDTYGYEVTNAMAKGDPDFVAYPDGTIVAMKGVYETTGNADNITQLANIINNNQGFEKTVKNYATDIVDLGTKQGFELVNQVAGLLTSEPEVAIPTVSQYGQKGAYALAINGDSYVESDNNNDTTSTSQMLTEAEEIAQFIDDNFVLKPKGSYYTDSILTLPEKYLDEEHIEKLAKAIALKIANLINSEEIVKVIKKNSGGGKIRDKVLTIVIDISNGSVYLGISGSSEYNPTMQEQWFGLVDTQTTKVAKWAIANNKPLPANRTLSKGKEITIETLKEKLTNCGESKGINNAISHNSNTNNLCVYSISLEDLQTYQPCRNCQTLYYNHIKSFIDFNINQKYENIDLIDNWKEE
jgi:hypothetical protein